MRNMGDYMGDYEAKQLILEVGRSEERRVGKEC